MIMGNRPQGFEDVDHIISQQRGIYGGESSISGDSAMDQFSAAHGVPSAQGVAYDINCENCGGRKLGVEWPEMIAIRVGVSPQIAQVSPTASAWGFSTDDQAWFPDVKCPTCNWPFRLMIKQGEANSMLMNAIQRGWVPDAYFQQMTQHCNQVKAGVQQQQQQRQQMGPRFGR
jgi:hypothetical protein